jgi:hypothetical protein
MMVVHQTQVTVISTVMSAMNPAAMDRDVYAMAVSEVDVMRRDMNTIMMSEVMMAAEIV